jgi:hypothetical protein
MDEPTAEMIEAGIDALIDAEDLRSPSGRERVVARIWRAMAEARRRANHVPGPAVRAAQDRILRDYHSSGSGERPGE